MARRTPINIPYIWYVRVIPGDEWTPNTHVLLCNGAEIERRPSQLPLNIASRFHKLIEYAISPEEYKSGEWREIVEPTVVIQELLASVAYWESECKSFQRRIEEARAKIQRLEQS